jgi:site-specific DNA-methyltransferase (adenine-specific)
VLDFFAGSGTTGAAAAALDRRFVLVDANPEALDVMRARLGDDPAYLDATGHPLPA